MGGERWGGGKGEGGRGYNGGVEGRREGMEKRRGRGGGRECVIATWVAV